jgi:hypothetical protein
MCNVVERMCVTLWKPQSEGSLHGGSLGHIAVHRSFIMLLRNYTPDEKFSSGEWHGSFRIFWDRDYILNLTAVHTSATVCSLSVSSVHGVNCVVYLGALYKTCGRREEAYEEVCLDIYIYI